jgi:hypothetical protein
MSAFGSYLLLFIVEIRSDQRSDKIMNSYSPTIQDFTLRPYCLKFRIVVSNFQGKNETVTSLGFPQSSQYLLHAAVSPAGGRAHQSKALPVAIRDDRILF